MMPNVSKSEDPILISKALQFMKMLVKCGIESMFIVKIIASYVNCITALPLKNM